MNLDTGVFTISIDFEFAWGATHREVSKPELERIRQEVAITTNLISLFEQYRVPATWAIVGHLLERDCWQHGVAHGDFPRAVTTGAKTDWVARHPAPADVDDELWFDRHGLIDRIRKSRVRHEIGSHSYSHIQYGSADTSAAAVEWDLEKAKAIHSRHGLPFSTFVYPRNSVGHKDLIRKAGLTCYRDYHRTRDSKIRGAAMRLCHALDFYLPTSYTSLPRLDPHGLVAIDDSMLLIGRNGSRRVLPPAFVVRKARKGLEQAARRREIFHLWFHPSNFAYQTDTQFSIFERILAHASQMRDQGELDVLTMGETADRWVTRRGPLVAVRHAGPLVRTG